ncbi:hypothetical protein [Geitlerinema sp. PCC 9228]|uniref:hypothetical protein n=1 Tax=Geitlerinema sp. PCC 9228 TaxID=111611 RepID=UPI001114B3E2|nr:hypothetical protein [Geitlerinema sp. PCC 9228]
MGLHWSTNERSQKLQIRCQYYKIQPEKRRDFAGWAIAGGCKKQLPTLNRERCRGFWFASIDPWYGWR